MFIIRKNAIENRKLFEKVANWEAKQLRKRLKFEEEMRKIAEKKNENPF